MNKVTLGTCASFLLALLLLAQLVQAVPQSSINKKIVEKSSKPTIVIPSSTQSNIPYIMSGQNHATIRAPSQKSAFERLTKIINGPPLPHHLRRPSTSAPDTTPPTTTLTSAYDDINNMTSGGSTFSNSIVFSFTGTSNLGISAFECRYDNQTFFFCNSPLTLTNVSLGVNDNATQHVFQVKAVDTSGKIDPNGVTFTWKRLRIGTIPGSVDGQFNEIGNDPPNPPCTTPDIQGALSGPLHWNSTNLLRPTGTWKESYNYSTGVGSSCQLFTSGGSAGTSPPAPWVSGIVNSSYYSTNSSTLLGASMGFVSNNSFVGGFRIAGPITCSGSPGRCYLDVQRGQDGSLTSQGELTNPNPPSGVYIQSTWNIYTSPDPLPATAITAVFDGNGVPISSGGTTSSGTFRAYWEGVFDKNYRTNAYWECSLDGSQFTNCTNFSPSVLNTGTHTLKVRSVDNDGNKDNTPASFTWNVDDCPVEGQSIPVTLQPIITNTGQLVKTKPYQISYGQLQLQFTSQPKSTNALCTLESNVGSLPVIISWPYIQSTGKQIATSTASVSLDFYTEGSAAGIPQCSALVLLQSNPNCFITALPNPSNPNAIVIKWSTAGFDMCMAGATPPVNCYNTGPKTFWVSADALTFDGIDSSNVMNPTNIDKVENIIHKTVSNYLPFVTRLAIMQDPRLANDILVTDPNGNSTGKLQTGKTITEIPGSSYITLGNSSTGSISAVIFPTPVEGIYQTEVIGNSTGPFTLDYSTLNFTGNFTNPSLKESALNDTISTSQIKGYDSTLSRDGQFSNITGVNLTTSKIFGISANGHVDQYDPTTGLTTKLFDIPSTVPPVYHNGRGIAFDGTNVWYTVVGTTTQIGDGRIHKSSLDGKDLGYIPDPYGEGGRGIGALVFDKQGYLWAVSYNPSNSSGGQNNSQTIFKLNSTNGNIVASCTASYNPGPTTTLAIANGGIITDLGYGNKLFEFDLPTTVGGNCVQTNTYKIPNVLSGQNQLRLNGMDTDISSNLIVTNGTSLFDLGAAPYNAIFSSTKTGFQGEEGITIEDQIQKVSLALHRHVP
jgi:hypothetical protein